VSGRNSGDCRSNFGQIHHPWVTVIQTCYVTFTNNDIRQEHLSTHLYLPIDHPSPPRSVFHGPPPSEHLVHHSLHVVRCPRVSSPFSCRSVIFVCSGPPMTRTWQTPRERGFSQPPVPEQWDRALSLSSCLRVWGHARERRLLLAPPPAHASSFQEGRATSCRASFLGSTLVPSAFSDRWWRSDSQRDGTGDLVTRWSHPHFTWLSFLLNM
jgi:hypothetical protein